MSSAPLRKCPSCGNQFKPGELGLREYSWVSELLPGKVGPTDIDFLLERNGDFLAIEFKQGNQRATRGQEITFDYLRKKGFEVWTVEGDGPNLTDESRLRVNWNGAGAYADMKRGTLAKTVVQWFDLRSKVRKPNTEGANDDPGEI